MQLWCTLVREMALVAHNNVKKTVYGRINLYVGPFCGNQKCHVAKNKDIDDIMIIICFPACW